MTGARGFIGRHLVKHLASKGFRVIGLGHGQWVEQDSRRWGLTSWLNGEVSSANLDALCIAQGVPELVFHLAGGSAVAPSFAAPLEDFNRSVGAAMALAEWLRSRSPSAPLVMASSAAVYGSGHDGQIKELANCRPYSPYGFHKRMAELALESYAANFGLTVRVVRFFSVYGPELKKQLLWDTCTKLRTIGASTLRLGGSGRELRDWLHIDDAVESLTLACSGNPNGFKILNGGTGLAVPVSEVAKLILEAWGSLGDIEFSGQSRIGDPPSLVSNASGLAQLGKTTFKPLKDGIVEYVEWFKQSHDHLI